MQPLTIRIPEDTKQSLETEASEYDVSVSEYVRSLIEKGREYDEIQDRIEAREARIPELEEKIESLPDKIRETESYQDRRRRALDNAGALTRLEWRVTGVPADAVNPENSLDDQEDPER